MASQNGYNPDQNAMFRIQALGSLIVCHQCFEPSDIYCPTCELSFCNACGDVHHSDESTGTHDVYIINRVDIPALEMAPLEDSSMQQPQEIDNSMPANDQTIYETYQNLLWKLWTFGWDLVTMKSPVKTVLAFFLMMVILIGMYIPSFPAYTVLPSEEVEPVNMICRHRTKEEVYQNMAISKKQLHRTVCTFYVFHYDLLSRNRTYFALDVDINIAKTYRDGKGLENCLPSRCFI